MTDIRHSRLICYRCCKPLSLGAQYYAPCDGIIYHAGCWYAEQKEEQPK